MTSGNLQTPFGPVHAPVAETRLTVQSNRIAQGLSNGTLTQADAQQLQTQYHQFNTQLAADKVTGTVNGQQRAQLQSQLNGLSADIFQMKHPQPPPPPSPNVPGAGSAGSLNGVLVWGDPHINDQNGNTTNFAQPNGLFVEQNANGTYSEVLVSAPASNQETDQVQVLSDSQLALPTDPTQTEVYVDQNGNIVDDGTAASLGFQSGGTSGTQVTPNAPVTTDSGTTVSFDGQSNVTFS